MTTWATHTRPKFKWLQHRSKVGAYRHVQDLAEFVREGMADVTVVKVYVREKTGMPWVLYEIVQMPVCLHRRPSPAVLV